MTNRPYYSSIEKISNHGLEQGIVPRFIFQLQKNYNFAFLNDNDRDFKFGTYINVVIKDLIPLYDLLQEIKRTHLEYKTTQLDGKHISINGNGVLNTDRTLEREIKEKVKTFFINGKILINDWSKCAIFDNDLFCLKKLLFVPDNIFNKNKLMLLEKDSDRNYEFLFDIIENARTIFLGEFIKIRNDIEHNDFILPNYYLNIIDGKILFEEPVLKGRNLIDALSFYFAYICELIEVIMVYYMGINSYINSHGMINTYERKQFDYKNEKYKFVVSPRKMDEKEYTLLIGE